MSHFTTLVVLDEYSESGLKAAMQPYHQFSCTGIDDEYVVEQNILEEAVEEYESDTQYGIYVRENGEKFYGFDASGEWCSELQPYLTKDEYGRDDLKNLPSHIKKSTDKEMAKDWFTFEAWASEHYGKEIIYGDFEPNINDKHKYGWVRIKNGKVVEIIRRTNPNYKWDWWTIGGRWAGRFLPKKGAKNYIVGEKSWGMEDIDISGKADVIRKGDIDFNKMTSDANENANMIWSDLEESFTDSELSDLKTIKTFSECWDIIKSNTNGNFNRDDVKDFYENQDPIIKYSERMESFKNKHFEGWWDSLEQILEGFDFQKYKNQTVYNKIGFFSILHDGKWMEKGEMGWFDVHFNEKENWNEMCVDYIMNLPDDKWMIAVDCHI